MDFINVEPCDLIQIITKIQINIIYLKLNESATIQVNCLDDSNKLLNTYIFELIQPEYTEWTNDEWLINYICEKYGFIINLNNVI